MRKSLLLALLLAGFASQGQVILSESFDGTTFPPSGWSSTTGGTGTPAAWAGTTAGVNPTQTPHSGAGEAWFNSYNASNGSAELITPSMSFSYATGIVQVSFWLYRDGTNYTSAAYATEVVDAYVNTSATATGGTLLGTIPRAINFTPTVATTGWYQYIFTVPAAFSGTTNYIIFKGTSAYGDNMFLDDVDVSHLVPCAGTPTAGTASASPNPVCPSVPLTLSVTGHSVGSGIIYQWQSSPAGLNTWTNIAGATTPTYIILAGITTATDYRLRDSCTNTGGGSSISNTVAVTLNSFTNCYCIPTYTNGGSTDYITNFVFGTLSNNTSSYGNPSPYYVNYISQQPTSIVIPSFVAGQTYTASVTFSSDPSQYSAIWVDFNHDGVFSTTEYFSLGTSPGSNGTANIPIAIPATSALGITRLRVRGGDDSQPFSSQACGPSNSTYGEAEDYNVNILSPSPPPAIVTNNSPVCPGGTFTITATSTYPSPTFTLTGPGISPRNNATGIFPIPNATTANNGTYSVIVSSGGFSSAAATTNVVVYNTPTAITTSNPVAPTTCLGTNGSFQICNLIPNSTYTLNYRKNNTAVAPSSITSDAAGCYTVAGLGVGSYDNIRVTSAAPSNCLSNLVTTPVIVPSPNPPATPVAVANSPVCPGSTMTLSVGNTTAFPAGTDFQWSATGFTPPSNTTGIATRPNMTAAFNGIYTVTATTTSGCSAQGSVTVTVNSPDPPPIANNITYCQFDVAGPMTAVPVPGATLKWYDTAGTLLPGAPTPPTLYPTPFPTNIIYYVSQTLVCESQRVPAYVIVNPKPLPPSVPDSNVSYCQFEQVGPLSASGSAVRWFTTLTGGTGSPTAPTPVTLVPGTFFFYVSQTVTSCESDRRTIRVIVKPKPEPPGVTSPLNICQGEPVAPLTAIGQHLLWYTIPSGGVGVPVAPLPNTGYEDSFKYYVTQTVNGCESDRALLAVYIRYRPNGIITASTQTVCQDASDTFFYYGNARPDAEYVWFAPLSAHFILGQGTPGPVIIHFDTSGTSVVQLIINNKGCISTLVAAPITVRPLPKISFVNRQDVCEDELVNVGLNGIEADITGYNWNFGSDDYKLEYGVLTTGGPFGVRYPNKGHYQISVTATKDFCTSKPIIQEIYVHEKPDARISSFPSAIDICASDTLFLSVQRVEEGAVYTWTPVAYFQGHRDTLNNSVYAVVSQNSEVKVTVRTAFGCEGSDSIKVTTKPCCGVYFANVFAPAGKVEQNRTFKPITTGVHRINTFRIVNRWGQVVYETKVERNGWDGTLNGAPQDMGTYYYYISYKCDGKNVEERGEFLLMR